MEFLFKFSVLDRHYTDIAIKYLSKVLIGRKHIVSPWVAKN